MFAISLVVEEEKCSSFTVVELRNGHRSAEATAKGIELLGCHFGEVKNSGVKRIVLQVLKHTAVKPVRAALGCERHVADLRELGIVIKRCDSHLLNSFRRRIRILE